MTPGALNVKEITLGEWLENKFIAWMSETGRHRTVSEFAAWLDIPRPLLSRYLNGQRQPSRENVDKIAARLGPEVYDLLGLQRPDPRIQRLVSAFDALDEEGKEELLQYAEQIRGRKSR